MEEPTQGEVREPSAEPIRKVERSLEEEAAGPTGSDGRETAADAPTSEPGEHAYKGEVEQPRRPPDDE